jgi:hypothetical protein
MPSGENVFALQRSGSGQEATALAWVRVVLQAGETTERRCLFDAEDGACDVEDLCDSGYTFGPLDEEILVPDPFVAETEVVSVPFEGSAPPGLVDLGPLSDGTAKLCVASAVGPFLYGSTGTGELLRIDTETAVATLIGLLPTGATEIEHDPNTGRAFLQAPNGAFYAQEFDVLDGSAVGGPRFNGGSFTGLEYVGSVLYGTVITGSGAPSTLRMLDPETGLSSVIGTTGLGPIAGLAYDEQANVLYGVTGGPGPADLVTLDLATGQATVIGSAGFQAGSLQFAPNGQLYGGGNRRDGGNLYRIDPATGAATLVGASGFASLTGLTLVSSIESEDCILFTKQGEEDLSINGAPCGAPTADAGADGTLECASAAGASVVLDGSASSDPNSSPGTNDDIALFEWFEDLGTLGEILLGTGELLDVTLGRGIHDLTLRVTDSFGEIDVDALRVEIVDTTAPGLAVDVSPTELWPPNHRLVPVVASFSASDACGEVAVTLAAVTSSEPDDGVGDGDTRNDIQGAAIGSADVAFDLRAERSGSGPGRTYVVTYTGSDASGNVTVASDLVFVPHDEGQIPDSDGDGLDDAAELFSRGTDLFEPDSDGDGFGDGDEVAQGTNPVDPLSFPGAPPTPIPVLSPLGRLLMVASLMLVASRLGRRGRGETV